MFAKLEYIKDHGVQTSAADLLAAQRQVSTKCTIYRTRELNSQLSTCVRVRSASLVLEIYHFESTFQSLFH